MDDPILAAARKRVNKKKKFYKHLVAFIAVGFFFFSINLATYLDGDNEIWFFFPMLPWSTGLIIHYLLTFGFPGSNILTPEWEAKQLDKEMQSLYEKTGHSQPKEDELNLEDFPRMSHKDWDKEDFV